MRRARPKRTDVNHRQVMAHFRQLGYLVLDLSAVGGGCPDLLLCRNHRLWLVEVKRPKAKYTPAGTVTEAQDLFRRQGWPVSIVTKVEPLTDSVSIRIV